MLRQRKAATDEVVRAIVDSGDIYTSFQPVINLSGKRILGFEAQNRSDRAEADPVRLSELSYEGCAPETRVRIDRVCREKALEEFRILHDKQGWLKLFLNVDASILQFEQSDFTYLLKQVEESGLPPESIVIEVGIDTVLHHIPIEVDAFYRELGFKTCIGGVDINQPFLDSLLRFEPTFIKIDGSFLPAGPNDSFRAKMLNGLMEYARKSGTTVIGLDVDSLNDSIRLLHSGIVFQQGGFFTLSATGGEVGSARRFFSNIDSAYEQFRSGRKEVRQRLRNDYNVRMSLSSSIAARVANASPDQYGPVLDTLVKENPQVSMGYVLNDAGTQITPAMCGGRVSEAMLAMDILPREGSDHSVEDLYLHIDAGSERFVSPTYFSRIAEQSCLLVARSFYSRMGLRSILVLEMAFPG